MDIESLVPGCIDTFNTPYQYEQIWMPYNANFGQNQELWFDNYQYSYYNNQQTEDFFFDKPENFRVKEAKKAELSEYKYGTCYKYNKRSGRNIRYYICQYDNCGRLFNKTWNFIDHVRIHTGDKPFKCDICNRGFAQKGNLNKHKKLHYSKMNTNK